MKKLLIFLFLTAVVRTACAQVVNDIFSGMNDSVVQWRHHIHQNPEVSFNEVHTSQYVESILKSLGNVEVLRPTATSVVGILRGPQPGKTVAFRADMDALPVQEETGLPYASSVAGVCHACGHDAHTAMLLGTASVLSQMQDSLRGTVYFVFQHAEEKAPGGAQEIIMTGALKDIDAMFGLHVLPNYPAGHIGILPAGAASTTADGFNLTITGKGSHGSMPHLGVDPIWVGSEVVVALQSVVSRNVNPDEMAVVSIGKFQAGDAPNVIPDKAELAASVRTVTEAGRQLVANRIKSIVDNITKAFGATSDLEYIYSYPAIQNDKALCALARAGAEKAVGATSVFDAPRMTASEDFSYYKQVSPVCFMVLGVGNGAANHSPKFTVDDAALLNGVKAEVQVILDYLNQGEVSR